MSNELGSKYRANGFKMRPMSYKGFAKLVVLKHCSQSKKQSCRNANRSIQKRERLSVKSKLKNISLIFNFSKTIIDETIF